MDTPHTIRSAHPADEVTRNSKAREPNPLVLGYAMFLVGASAACYCLTGHGAELGAVMVAEALKAASR